MPPGVLGITESEVIIYKFQIQIRYVLISIKNGIHFVKAVHLKKYT